MMPNFSQIYAARMQEEGIYVTGFYYPVVPKDQARIRVQISAGHEREHLDKVYRCIHQGRKRTWSIIALKRDKLRATSDELQVAALYS